MTRRPPLRPAVLVPMIAGWLAVVTLGLGALTSHSFAAGEHADAPASWPSDSVLGRAPNGFTLVVVAHPKCGCTRATLSELAWLMTRVEDRVTAYVLLSVPSDLDGDWRDSEHHRRAREIDGVTVVPDPDGLEAERFGAATSGQVYLFDEAGTLRFEGGITPSRAHEGDNIGRRRILALVDGDPIDRERSAVFGCGLWDEAAREFWLPGWRSRELVIADRRHDDGI
jgi:hypothetical protein